MLSEAVVRNAIVALLLSILALMGCGRGDAAHPVLMPVEHVRPGIVATQAPPSATATPVTEATPEPTPAVEATPAPTWTPAPGAIYLDPSFRIAGALVDGDRMFLVGNRIVSSGAYAAAVLCLDADGAVDPSFGDGGLALVPDSDDTWTIGGIVLRDHRLRLAIGAKAGGGAVVTFDASGNYQPGARLDSASRPLGLSGGLADDGVVSLWSGTSGSLVRFTGDTPTLLRDGFAHRGRILTGADGATTWIVDEPQFHTYTIPATRITSDGALDPGFGEGGNATLIDCGDVDRNACVKNATFDPDGRMLLFYMCWQMDAREETRIARFDSPGTADAAFYDRGITEIPEWPVSPRWRADGSFMIPDLHAKGFATGGDDLDFATTVVSPTGANSEHRTIDLGLNDVPVGLVTLSSGRTWEVGYVRIGATYSPPSPVLVCIEGCPATP